MNCIECGYKTMCVDSRLSGQSVRRRHKCRRESCGIKFTTLETAVERRNSTGRNIEDSFHEQMKQAALESLKKELADYILNFFPSANKFDVLAFGSEAKKPIWDLEIDAGKQ